MVALATMFPEHQKSGCLGNHLFYFPIQRTSRWRSLERKASRSRLPSGNTRMLREIADASVIAIPLVHTGNDLSLVMVFCS